MNSMNSTSIQMVELKIFKVGERRRKLLTVGCMMHGRTFEIKRLDVLAESTQGLILSIAKVGLISQLSLSHSRAALSCQAQARDLFEAENGSSSLSMLL
jgi:hypothetical protein